MKWRAEWLLLLSLAAALGAGGVFLFLGLRVSRTAKIARLEARFEELDQEAEKVQAVEQLWGQVRDDAESRSLVLEAQEEVKEAKAEHQAILEQISAVEEELEELQPGWEDEWKEEQMPRECR